MPSRLQRAFRSLSLSRSSSRSPARSAGSSSSPQDEFLSTSFGSPRSAVFGDLSASGTESTDDEEEDDDDGDVEARDFVDPSEPPTTTTTPHHHRLDYEDASSIIGGESISGSQQPTSGGADPEKKTFSFSLPFNSPLASFDLSNFKIRSLFKGSGREMPEDFPEPPSPDQLRTISSRDEEEYYKHVQEQDNSRLRAVRHSLMPNLSIDSLNPLSPPRSDRFPSIDGDVIIMGGYRGSILRDRRTGRRVWIPIKVGLNLRYIDLTVGMDDSDEWDMDSKVYPDGMLTHIGPIDISRKLIRKLSAQPGCRVHEFGYDWRLSCDINSVKLRQLMKKIQSTQRRKRPIIVIAHSMGGLIAHHAMQNAPELFRGLLYAGVPASCPNILGPLRHGDSVLMSSNVLTAKINFLMRSSYVFLPIDGRCFVDKDDTSKRYDLDFFDVNTWINYELSPCVSKSLEIRRTQTKTDPRVSPESVQPAQRWSRLGEEAFKRFSSLEGSDTFTLPDNEMLPFEDAVEYLQRTLERTRAFLHDLEYDESKEHLYPPLAVVYGHAVPTLRGARVKGADAIKYGDYQDLVFGAGDGVVYHKWLMPALKGFKPVIEQPSNRGHVGLLTDIEGVGKALTAILDEEARRAAAY